MCMWRNLAVDVGPRHESCSLLQSALVDGFARAPGCHRGHALQVATESPSKLSNMSSATESNPHCTPLALVELLEVS